MKIISLNAREWSRDMNPFSPHFWMKRMSKMRKMLLLHKPDVICFQEMRWPATWYIPNGYMRLSNNNTSHPIYIKTRDRWRESLYPAFTNNHSSYVRIDLPYGRLLHIFNVHLSCDNEIRKAQLNKLSEQACLYDTIICGDFNATPENVMPYFPHLKQLSQDICTYESFETGAVACIDHFIGDIEGRYVYIDEDSWGNRMSDHYPIMIEI